MFSYCFSKYINFYWFKVCTYSFTQSFVTKYCRSPLSYYPNFFSNLEFAAAFRYPPRTTPEDMFFIQSGTCEIIVETKSSKVEDLQKSEAKHADDMQRAADWLLSQGEAKSDAD